MSPVPWFPPQIAVLSPLGVAGFVCVKWLLFVEVELYGRKAFCVYHTLLFQSFFFGPGSCSRIGAGCFCRNFCIAMLKAPRCAALSVYSSFSKCLAGCVSEGLKQCHSCLVFHARLSLQLWAFRGSPGGYEPAPWGIQVKTKPWTKSLFIQASSEKRATNGWCPSTCFCWVNACCIRDGLEPYQSSEICS